MKEVDKLFEVSAVTPEGLSLLGKGIPGFRIPPYQRPYDWEEKNIVRLVSSMFTGLERLCDSTKADAYTFLGSIILVEDETQEASFKGKSFAVVDGQQRITTLSLLSCAIIEKLRILYDGLPKLPRELSGWLESEFDFIERSLIKTIVGKQEIKGDKTFPFPRIVRSNDTRGTSIKEQDLQSGIAKFLVAFNSYYSSNENVFVLPELPDTRESRKLISNFKYLQELVDCLNDPEWHQENDCRFLPADRFRHGGLKNLLEKLKDTAESDGQKEITLVEKNEKLHDFFRTLLLAGYICNCVAITIVTTDDETAAFDIFDALNTTGEPLTALEVLKPVVVSYLDKEKTHPGYQGSEAEHAFSVLDDIFEDEIYEDTQAKQDETKRTVITSALVIAGEKISEKLSIQRTEVRKYFAAACDEDAQAVEKFVGYVSQIARFRHDYWNDRQLLRLNLIHKSSSECEELKLIFGFLTAMKTSMALPILFRFWAPSLEKNDFTDYVKAARAVAAFVALRRSATEKTDGIDTCFRDLMAMPKSGKRYGFCTGTKFTNPAPDVADLQAALVKKLESKKLKFGASADKAKWVSHCSDVPIYSAAQPLARFLLLAAHHKTGLDPAKNYLPKREGAIVDEEREFLSYSKWMDARYQSVEHIAPNTDGAKGWKPEVLGNVRLRNSLGNLTLLPVSENNHISNAEWEKKKLFYAALCASTEADRKVKLKHAETLSKPFKKTTWNVVDKSPRLSLLDGLAEPKDWSKTIIEERSERLLSLAWDELWPWIDPT